MITGRVSLPKPFGLLHRIEPDTWQSEGRGFESRQVHMLFPRLITGFSVTHFF